MECIYIRFIKHVFKKKVQINILQFYKEKNGLEEMYLMISVKNNLLLIFAFIPLLFMGCDSTGGIEGFSMDLESMDAVQFTKVLGNGINLGNTFESNAANWMGYNAEPVYYETGWGQPVTTKDMLKAMKDSGFDSIRIPVAWTSTMDWRNNDYEINNDFMQRVKEVVDWALDAGLYVIINDHWDYQWWGLFGSNKSQAYKIFDAIWNQVGTNFKDYDYRLIFEAGNEEWGERFNDEVDKVKGNLTTSEQYLFLTELAQHFVDKIRAQGSKNEKRFLLIPGFNTDIDKTCSDLYVLPEDKSNSIKKLLVSVHYYAPATFCIVSDPKNSWGYKAKWGSQSDISEQNKLLAKMEKFVKQDYGVIVGEYACVLAMTQGYNTQDTSDDVYVRKEGDTAWIKNVLDNCDKYNYAPFLWDCNTYFSKTGKLGFTGNYTDVGQIFSE